MTASRIDLARASAAAAGLLLAVLSRGDASVLAVLLVVAAWRLPALAVVPALVASSWRWGSTSLDALAGAQAVLGPAGSVGPGRAAAGVWLAGVALVASTPARRGSAPDSERALAHTDLVIALAAAALAASAADVVAGPSRDGAWGIRVVATALAAALALVVSRVREGRERSFDVVAVVAGLGALIAVAGGAPSWAGTIDGGAIRTAGLLAAVVAALAFAGGSALAAMGNRRA